MFGKKKAAVEEKPKAEVKPKEKKLSPKEIMLKEVEVLTAEQTLSFKLPEPRGGGFLHIQLNPEYPTKGKKFLLYREDVKGGQPTGKKIHFLDFDKTERLANYLVDMQAQSVK